MKIKNLPVFVYDIEVFPNLFTCAVKNTESGNKLVYEVSIRKNELNKIAELFEHKNIMFCGYNNKFYDDSIINYILINYEELIVLPYLEICKKLKEFSDLIINSEGNNFNSWTKYKHAYLFNSLDLLAMMFSNKLRVGLKAMQVTMQYPNVREYEGDFNKSILISEIDNLISYNINDIESTEELLNRCKKDIDLRLAIEEKYGIKALNKDGVNLGMEIIKHRYLEKTGLTWNQIKDLRSPCDYLCLNDIIFPFIEFRTPVLQELLKDLKEQCINPNDNSFERTFEIGGLKHTFGLGGLHSINTPEIIIPSSTQVLRDYDVTSLYPSIVIEHKVCPEHLKVDIFVGNFADMKAERVEAKIKGDKITNETLKLALNGFTGNLQSQFSWVYSPKAALTIRINGQLMLCMLAERLAEIGVRLIQTNTDGIFFVCEKFDLPAVERVCKEWESITKLNLEADSFERFYQYAINDYLGVKEGYSETKDYKFIKTKGLFLDKITLGKGMSPLIIAEALREYFVNDIPVENTIKNCTDIKKFLTYQKISKDFVVEYNKKLVTHINRYYMSTNGAKLYKCKINPDTGERYNYIDVCATGFVTLFNELQDISPKEAHVDFNWYIRECYKIIYPLEDSLNPTLF